MERILLYSQVLYVPVNIKADWWKADCERLGITYEYYKAEPRTYTFYGKEEDLRYLRTKHILKPIV